MLSRGTGSLRVRQRTIMLPAAALLVVVILLLSSRGASPTHSLSTRESIEALSATGQRFGNRDAPVVIVVFGTYACGFCATFDATLDSVRADRPATVAVAPKSFAAFLTPLQMRWHVAAECAAESGSFAAYHTALFKYPEIRARRAGWLELAEQVGVREMASFFGCVESQRPLASIMNDTRAATQLGVAQTPTWFIGDRMFIGAHDRKFVDSVVSVVLLELDRDV